MTIPLVRYCRTHDRVWEQTDDLIRCPVCIDDRDSPLRDLNTIIVGGEDLAKFRDYSALVVLEIWDRVAKIKGLKLWPHGDYSVTLEQTRNIYRRTGMRLLGLDQTSMGEPILEMYQSAGMVVQGVKFSVTSKAEMIEMVRGLLRKGQLKMPTSTNQTYRELETQMKEQEIVIGASEAPHFRSPANRHDDLLWALCIACYVARPWLSAAPLWSFRMR